MGDCQSCVSIAARPALDAARSGSYCRRDVFQLTEGGKLGLDVLDGLVLAVGLENT
jgi:hypothetical protein